MPNRPAIPKAGISRITLEAYSEVWLILCTLERFGFTAAPPLPVMTGFPAHACSFIITPSALKVNSIEKFYDIYIFNPMQKGE